MAFQWLFRHTVFALLSFLSLHPENQICNDMEERILSELAQIKAYSLLGAKNVLNFEDVVLLTGLSKSHLYKLTCNKQIPHYKPNGKQVYFDRAEVEAWMRQNRVNTQMEAEQQAVSYVVTGKKGGQK